MVSSPHQNALPIGASLMKERRKESSHIQLLDLSCSLELCLAPFQNLPIKKNIAATKIPQIFLALMISSRHQNALP
jgi:hypothetical protein